MRRYSLFAISPSLAADVIIETMPSSMIVTDLDGRILLLNENAQRFFKVPASEVEGKLICELFKSRADFDKLYEDLIEKNLEVERFEAVLVDPHGEMIPSLINANKIHDALGATLGIVYIIRDIRG
jgi:PAS domain S-box-containing protein